MTGPAVRHAGVMLPLFSLVGPRSWGIGEFRDLVPLSEWLSAAGFDRLLLLPISVLPDGDSSPYGAASSMAIDPMFIAIEAVPEWAASAPDQPARLTDASQADLDFARGSPRVDYARVRRAKREALDLAFARFVDAEWNQLTTRAAEFASYMSRERWWLDDWALYAAIALSQGLADWRLWPPPLRDRESGAIAEARRQLAREILRQQYLQWIAEGQWQATRAAARQRGVAIFGDMPFMAAAASPDVWCRPSEYMFDVSLGVPPDAFSATGQDWGLPTYRWDRIAATGYAWLSQRARRMAALFDGFRVDHVVGLYRTFGRRGGATDGFFNPDLEEDQTAQGERILALLAGTGATIIAEDLGVIPDFVRASLDRSQVPGCKVMRWERDWHAPGRPFRDPASYRPASAAMTGTHDTETLAAWWSGADRDERTAAIAMLAAHAGGTVALPDPGDPWSPALRDLLLTAAYASGSNELFIPFQDLAGWWDRINTPGTVDGGNWSWRMPWPVDALARIPDARERMGFLGSLARQYRRGPARPIDPNL